MLGRMTNTTRSRIIEEPSLISDTQEQTGDDNNRVIMSYAILGLYDYLFIVEAESNEDAAILSLAISNKTGINLETYPTIVPSRMKENDCDQLPKDTTGHYETTYSPTQQKFV